jgi:signal transduction histidine kinase
MVVIRKIRNMRLSISTKLILSMAGLVVLSAVTSLLISNMIIHNQTRQLEESLQKISVQLQEARKQNAQPASVTVDQIKEIVNNTTTDDSPDVTLGQVRRALSNSDVVNGKAMLRIVRDSGFPVSDQNCLYRTAEISVRSPNPSVPPPPGPGPEKCSDAGAFFSYPVGQAIAWGSLFSVLCAVALGFLISRNIIRPLRALEHASERIADGNYNHEIKLEDKDELGRLAHSFNRMARALRLTEQKRKDLVADVSHEFRTPLSSIQGYTEVLRDGLVPSRERQEEILDHILKEVKHLTGMVNSMRAWVSNEQSLEHLNIEEMPVNISAAMVVERFRPAAETKKVNLELDVAQPAPLVRADSDALNHILSNLVDNALRYTDEGGTIAIKIKQNSPALGDKQPEVHFEVSDTGCGIASEHLPFIFERFYRVDKSRDRMTGGSGLGLAIVRDTVQALGGDVKIESTPGKGTKILFNLPGVRPPRRERKRRPIALEAR